MRKKHTIIWITIPLITLHVILLSSEFLKYIEILVLIIVFVIFETIVNYKRGKKHLYLVIIGLILSIIIYILLSKKPIEVLPIKKDNTADNSTTIKEDIQVVEQVYKDGVYTGQSMGYHDQITVEITFDHDIITTCSVTSINDDVSFYQNAPIQICEDIVSSNGTTDVYGVGGATFSSNGIIGAANNAIESAKN